MVEGKPGHGRADHAADAVEHASRCAGGAEIVVLEQLAHQDQAHGPHRSRGGAEQEQDWEGCLSVPGLRGAVPRFVKIRYRGLDLFGKPIDRVAEGFHARVLQHECDHLDGILYPQRMTDLSLLVYLEENVRYPIDLGHARDKAAE